MSPAEAAGAAQGARTGRDGATPSESQMERRVALLQDRIRQLDRQLAQATTSNERLVSALGVARDELRRIRASLEPDDDATLSYGTVVAVRPAVPAPLNGPVTQTQAARRPGVDVMLNGRKIRARMSPLLALEVCKDGDEVLLDESLQIVAVYPAPATGQVLTVKEVMGARSLLVATRSDEERVVARARSLVGESIRVGDGVVVDLKTNTASSRVERQEVQDLIMEETPDVSYADIGGLGPQIEQITDAVELPFLHADEFRAHRLTPPKGILLYGPPGCGKTLIAKAVARSLSDRAREAGRAEASQSWFFNIKGPELLDKYVGETERHIRTIFARARERAANGNPVIVFFDEMDSLFRTRGSGVSSDVETTIVPQLLAEIDGVERLDNVIVIGATNREDMIDPAILRPGRLDVKIRVERPTRAGAREILGKHLTPEVPLAAGLTRDELIDAALESIYREGPDRDLVEVVFAGGTRSILRFSDFISGAVLRNVVDRAKTAAVKDVVRGAARGLTVEHIRGAVDQECREIEDLPSTSSPDEWARVLGRRGEPIVALTNLAHAAERS
ncbi:proteasome ATPase [Falsarthrobacter nasiphocae]|uniref:AAA ATPase forming ring-shaped complexes n=1 Tax=Falsarthrobacter nasiphocae TaxID=189863 RepID=A0AAE3YFC3_9MICC|nr:proteasome ATPase [Falsarthrobacter nasiphocae]MDR6891109.1 proteasome-associated ATPase [Falsarthrobacter nasiphocae]